MNKTNAEIARMLRMISYLLDMGETKSKKTNFKNRAYNTAAEKIDNLSISIVDLYKSEGIKRLLSIPSIGKDIASKIEEFINTNEIQYYNQLRSELPLDIEFLELKGIGPRTLKSIYDKVVIKNIEDLEKAAIEGKIRDIPGFSQKKEESILKKIKNYKDSRNRFPIGEIYPFVKQIERHLSEIKGVKKAITVGSFLRMKDTIRDIDYLVASNDPQKVIESFVNMSEVKQVLGKGSSKAFVKLNNGMNSDLLVVPDESYGAALLYFTGNKQHGINLRKIASSKNLKLNEWGLYDKSKGIKIAGETEEEIYTKLGLEWIPPEMRENKGEIELSKTETYKKYNSEENKISQLIGYEDLKGDLQVHTNNTDGKMSIEQMVLYAADFGLEYIAITDHTKSLKIARGLDEAQLLNQANKISELNEKIKADNFFTDLIKEEARNNNYKKLKNFRILSSAEVNILKDGSLDISNNILDKLDIVGAAIHSSFSLPIETQTKRLVDTALNPSVDIIFHPTGRIINKRDGYPVNIPKLVEVAKDTKTILEVDAAYERLDLKDDHIKIAIDNGVKIVIDSDAHHPLHYVFLKFGIGQARRGWATKKDVINALPVQEMLDNLKQ